MLAKFLNKINENYKQIGKIKTSTFSFFQYNTLFKFSFFLHKKKYNLVIIKVYLDATKNVAPLRTTNHLLMNNIRYKIRFLDF